MPTSNGVNDILAGNHYDRITPGILEIGLALSNRARYPPCGPQLFTQSEHDLWKAKTWNLPNSQLNEPSTSLIAY